MDEIETIEGVALGKSAGDEVGVGKDSEDVLEASSLRRFAVISASLNSHILCTASYASYLYWASRYRVIEMLYAQLYAH